MFVCCLQSSFSSAAFSVMFFNSVCFRSRALDTLLCRVFRSRIFVAIIATVTSSGAAFDSESWGIELEWISTKLFGKIYETIESMK